MRVGTKSILFGAHQFLVHPWFVAAGWWKLYGFPWDPRLWTAFFVHDLGYIGAPNMDGPEGELHPALGAAIMGMLFGPEWHDFTLYHSRFFAKRMGMPISRLCVADKQAIIFTPGWIYIPMATLSGEIYEYRDLIKDGKYTQMNIDGETSSEWHRKMQDYLRRWVAEHKDTLDDTWTKLEEKH